LTEVDRWICSPGMPLPQVPHGPLLGSHPRHRASSAPSQRRRAHAVLSRPQTGQNQPRCYVDEPLLAATALELRRKEGADISVSSDEEMLKSLGCLLPLSAGISRCPAAPLSYSTRWKRRGDKRALCNLDVGPRLEERRKGELRTAVSSYWPGHAGRPGVLSVPVTCEVPGLLRVQCDLRNHAGELQENDEVFLAAFDVRRLSIVARGQGTDVRSATGQWFSLECLCAELVRLEKLSQEVVVCLRPTLGEGKKAAGALLRILVIPKVRSMALMRAIGDSLAISIKEEAADAGDAADDGERAERQGVADDDVPEASVNVPQPVQEPLGASDEQVESPQGPAEIARRLASTCAASNAALDGFVDALPPELASALFARLQKSLSKTNPVDGDTEVPQASLFPVAGAPAVPDQAG